MNKELLSDYTAASAHRNLDAELVNDIQDFFNKVSHLDISDSETDEGLRLIIIAFKDFLKKQECWNSLVNFDELLIEKGKSDPYRNNKRTPNILHEIRNCMHSLSMIVDGTYDMDAYREAGGIDTDMSARLRHDSIEDKAQSRIGIYNRMIDNLNKLVSEGLITEFTYSVKAIEASVASYAIDFMSSKEAKTDSETGQVIWKDKEKMKPVTEKRYGGDPNQYFNKLQEIIFSLLGKYSDRSENISSRLGHTTFTVESNEQYVTKTRRTYSTENYKKSSIEMHPKFSAAIIASDAMLGLQTDILSGMNKYMAEKNADPYHGREFDLGRHAIDGLKAYQHLPKWAHPVSISIDNARIEAGDNMRLHYVINNFIIPPIRKAIEKQGLKSIDRVQSFLFEKEPKNEASQLHA